MPESAHNMIDIDKKLNELPPMPSERCIFRVLDRLRNENKKAYKPEVVAIGPYHHGKDNLQPMEEHKLRYLKQLLNRRNETSAERYMVAMRESEQKARRFYADPISLDSNKYKGTRLSKCTRLADAHAADLLAKMHTDEQSSNFKGTKVAASESATSNKTAQYTINEQNGGRQRHQISDSSR
ncbi:UPF0481 protein [Camellia lanceoleosa]|uniref:UPF0481 protein n=1 Tax=Camellia lanceoleosa TaxID=1840588 RepID=A0ACC0HGU4_9ERIC|nr:UPF0481 protein [Camellia lanceoleosa]